MSRYDGLIIPRSYNEYINKTDPVAMSQALQLNNVLAQEVAAGNNKAVTSNAVNNALANYQTKIKTKEVIKTSSANGNIDFELSGKKYTVISVQSFNTSGFNNDTIIIPFKLGDGPADTGSTNGRWGGHCIVSNANSIVKSNETIYATITYFEN